MTHIIFNFSVCLLFLTAISIESLCAENNNQIIFQNSRVEQSDDYINGNIYQKDLLLYFDMLGSTHPAFATNVVQPFKIKELCKKGYKWAENCSSTTEFWAYLQRITSSLNDGHTALYADYNNSRVYPFMLYDDGEGFYLYTTTKQYSSYLGKKIIKINGSPVKEVVDSFKPLFSCDNEIDFNQKIKKQISFEVLWIKNPYKSADNMLHLAFDDGTSISLEPIAVNNGDLVAQQIKHNPSAVRQNSKDLFRYQIIEDQSICYLQFNLCEDQSSLHISLLNNNSRGLTSEQIKQAVARYPRFDSFLNSMFEEIASKGVKTLVIDVRDNRGGNSHLCEVLISWLKPIENQIVGASKSRLSELWEKSYPQIALDYKEVFSKNGLPYRLGEMYDNQRISNIMMSKDGQYKMFGIDIDEWFVKNRDPEKVFNGNVVFIQNEGTYSSAGMLITNSLDNGIGVVVGSKSPFSPCHYGDMLSYELPNTKIKGTISYKLFLRPDSAKCNEKYILPTVDLKYKWSDLLEGNDVYWNWIVSKISVSDKK